MATPILRTDSPREILLSEQRAGPAMLFVVCLGIAFGSRAIFPGSRTALIVFGAIGLWALVSLLRVHDLRLDLVERRFAYRRGWLGTKPLVSGGFERLHCVAIEANDAVSGPVASRLRSRLLLLHFDDWPLEPQPLAELGGVFPLGFPMGPRVAAEKGADYALRLGVPLVDRTAPEAADGAGAAAPADPAGPALSEPALPEPVLPEPVRAESARESAAHASGDLEVTRGTVGDAVDVARSTDPPARSPAG